MVHTARGFGPDRQTPRIQTGNSPGILVLTDKHLAFKLGNIARKFGSDRKTPRIYTGKNRREFRPGPKNASRLNCEILPGISVLTEKRPAFNLEKKKGISVLADTHLALKLGNIARSFGSDRVTPRS